MKRIAIIGLGGISEVHIAAIVGCEFGKIEAICDIEPEKIENAKKAIPYPVKEYSDYKEMLKDVKADVVHICTPHYLHAEMTIEAMRSGADVYLEKPAAMDPEEGLEMLKVQKETGRKVCVSFQNRVTVSNLEAKRIIDSGEMGGFLGARGFMTWDRGGEYYTKSTWRGRWATEGGGVLMNQSIHTLDLLYYFGGDIARTEGTASLRKNGDIIEVEDTAEATIFYENGKNAIFYASNCNAANSPVIMEVFLEKGSLMIIGNSKLFKDVGNGYELIADDSKEAVVGKAVWGCGHAKMMERFYSSIDGNEKYYCTLEDGLKILKVIEDIYKTSPNNFKGIQ